VLVLETPPAPTRLRELDLAGKTLWEKTLGANDYPSACQPLADGRVFVVFDDRIAELDRAGREVFRRPCNDGLLDAVKLGDGRFLCAEPRGLALRDADGAEKVLLTRFQAVQWSNRTVRLAALPGDGCAAAVVETGQVFRLTPGADPAALATLPGVQTLSALGDGHLLAVQLDLNGATGRVVELDAGGRVVWEVFSLMQPQRAHPCLGLLRVGLERPRPDGFSVDSPYYRTENLKDPDPLVRRRGAVLLGRFQEKALPALEALLGRLADDDAEVRDQAAWALARIGDEARAPLTRALKERPEAVRVGSARALGRMGRAARESAEPLTAALKDGRAATELRAAAAEALGEIGPETGREALMALAAAVKDAEPAVRRHAALALAQVGPDDARTVPLLIAALKDARAEVRTSATTALGRLGPRAQPAVAELVDLLKRSRPKEKELDRSEGLRIALIHTLGAIGPGAKEAAGPLGELIKDAEEEVTVRRSAVAAVGKLGPEAAGAVPALLDVLQDADLSPSLARTVAEALGGLGKDGVLALAEAAAVGNGRLTRRYAIQALMRLGERAEPAVPALTEAAADPDSYIASTARRTLARFEKPK
jgi:HEAT repeat protein